MSLERENALTLRTYKVPIDKKISPPMMNCRIGNLFATVPLRCLYKEVEVRR